MIKWTALLILLVTHPLSLVLAEDWPQWRGPGRNGISKETGLLQSWPAGGPRLLWTFRDAGEGYSGMCVVSEKLYSMEDKNDKEYVYSVDLKNQKRLWSAEVGPHVSREGQAGFGGPYSTPAVDDKFLYALGGHGNLICVETDSGKKVWSQELKTGLGGYMPSYGYTESPLVDGDQVIVSPGGDKGWIAAFDKKTGSLKWRTSPDANMSAPYSSMIAIEVSGVRQYVLATRGTPHVLGVRASDGKVLWTSDGMAVDVKGTPIYHNECVYLSSFAGCQLIKLTPKGDKFEAEEIYSNEEMQNEYGSVTLVGEYIYGYSDKWGFMCQELKTGKIAWKTSPKKFTRGHYWQYPGMGKANVIFADGNLYCFYENRGDMILLKATSNGYQEQGKFCVPEATELPLYAGHTGDFRLYTQPTLANGKLYLRDQDLIFCYDVRKSR